ncbi:MULTISPECIES: LysR family transcriptional regulator [Thalassospira]|uniref:LysR family transcriptional regulator n=2 Tax=Thalassospira TaxID=168934 RepID=A0A367WF70_9PROT|nr:MULTISPECIES: LysR family transcriptional regulator [Thalassospira]MDG4717379.1 LysR family transcriptional regulator [Thalassospira sp. FZY0004]RCK39142.1 LysR family transcriptional regulator [Thalassospira profundimaris]
MDNIDHFNLRSFDLNLMIAFDAMMQEMSVTKAAEKLRIGQSAMSHNLSTLRMLLADELFVRVGQKMQPTAKARALAGPVRTALSQAQNALQATDCFDPAKAERVFRLGVTGEMEMILLPELVRHLQREAPGTKILSRSITTDTVDTMINNGEIDLAIGCKTQLQTGHHGELLFNSEVACCFNPELTGLSAPITRAQYLASRHAVLSQTENVAGCVGAALQGLGIDLNVVMAAPDFMPLLAAARNAPVVATVPCRIAIQYAPLFGLSFCPMPIDIGFPPVTMNWAVWTDKDVGLVWLRDQIRGVIDSIDPNRIVLAAE